MKLEVFTVFDEKTKAYMRPFYDVSKGSAIRAFADTVNGDDQHPFRKHPEDYTLFHLGAFDDGHAQFEMFAAPMLIITALEVIDRFGDQGELFNSIREVS